MYVPDQDPKLTKGSGTDLGEAAHLALGMAHPLPLFRNSRRQRGKASDANVLRSKGPNPETKLRAVGRDATGMQRHYWKPGVICGLHMWASYVGLSTSFKVTPPQGTPPSQTLICLARRV